MELNERDIDLRKEAPSLSAIGNGIPFTVPSGYFEDLSDKLKSRVTIESLRLNDQDGFSVPQNYFEELPGRIEDSIAAENIRTFSSAEGFSVPEGYFEELSTKINSRLSASPKKEAKVIRLLTSWVGYAAAACITVMIATGIYFSSNTNSFKEQLSQVPDEEIINYLQAHSTAGDTPFIIETLNPDELDQISPDLSSEELELYINSTTL